MRCTQCTWRTQKLAARVRAYAICPYFRMTGGRFPMTGGSAGKLGGSAGNFGGSAYLNFHENSDKWSLHSLSLMFSCIGTSTLRCKNKVLLPRRNRLKAQIWVRQVHWVHRIFVSPICSVQKHGQLFWFALCAELFPKKSCPSCLCCPCCRLKLTSEPFSPHCPGG